MKNIRFGQYILAPFQKEVVQAALKALRQGYKKQLIVFPTGLGKTIIIFAIAKMMGCKRILFLSHTKELRAQAIEKAGKFFFQDFVSATVQSVYRNPINFNHRLWDLVVVDEAHHSEAPMYQKILDTLKTKALFGLTATPYRTDQQNLLNTFEYNSYKLDMVEALDRGLFVKIIARRIKTKIHWDDIVGKDKEYTNISLKRLFVPKRDRLIFEEWKKHCKGRRTICFTISVKHANSLAKLWQINGFRAASVSGRTSDGERKSIIEAFKSGQIHTIFACNVLNEGFDCPEADALLMTRPTLSKIIYLQQVGRSLRNMALFGKQKQIKKDILVLDFTDNSTTLGLTLNEVFDCSICDSENDIRSLRQIKDLEGYKKHYDQFENREVELIEVKDLDLRTKSQFEIFKPLGLLLKQIQDTISFEESCKAVLSIVKFKQVDLTKQIQESCVFLKKQYRLK